MPRVLLVFEPPDGGVATQVEQLATGLGEHGWQVEVAGPPEALVYPALAEAGVPVHRLGFVRGYRSPWRDAEALLGLARLLRRGSYDLVHLHSSKAGALGRLAAAALRVPAVYTPHCYGFIMPGSALTGRVAVALERLLGPLTALTVCVCEAERRSALARRIVRPGRLRVVLNASPAPQDGAGDDAGLAAFRGEGPLAAVVTTLRRQKRVDLLLEAAPLVLARVPQARIAVVGDGPLRDELRHRAAELGLDDRVRFFPFVAPASRQLRGVDVYVLPSDWEALSIGLLEALACGVPQVATDVGGTAEVVTDDTGVLVPPGDPAALADAVAGLLADGGRRERLAEASRRRHRDGFTLDRMLGETAAVYRDAVPAVVRTPTPVIHGPFGRGSGVG